MLRSEDDFLALIDRCFPNAGPGILTGRGDDCAVLEVPGTICLTTDLFLEGTHFRLDYFSPGDVGHKALAVNLSDIAGMGARPLGFSLGLMVPPGLDQGFFEELFAAMAALAERSGCPLTGGDLSRADRLGLSITAWGGSPRFLARGSCRPGDLLFTLGPLGLARTGLLALEQEGLRAATRSFPAAVAAHLRPEVDLPAALTLSQSPAVQGLMDVSDGLARDLPRFLGPELGLEVALLAADLPPEVTAWAQRTGSDPFEFALLGGEDYALLGAASPQGFPALQAALPGLTRLGKVLDTPGLWRDGERLALAGFDHFTGETPKKTPEKTPEKT